MTNDNENQQNDNKQTENKQNEKQQSEKKQNENQQNEKQQNEKQQNEKQQNNNKTREEVRLEKEAKQEKKLPKRIRMIPIWIRIILVALIFSASLIAGAMFGYGVIGKGDPKDVIDKGPWQKIHDIIYKDSD